MEAEGLSTTSATATQLVDAATGAVGAFESTIASLSASANKSGPSAFLMGIGAFLVLLPVAARVYVAGESLVSLTTGEFIALVAAGVLLTVVGALMRLYWLKVQVELAKTSRQLGTDLFRDVTTAATKLSQTPVQGALAQGDNPVI
jgi:hypothetical protein